MPTPLDFRLSANFTFGELTDTSQAALLTKNRAEAERYLDAGKALATTILQPIRDRWGPLKINSGFRGPSLNARVKGSPSSQHCLFQAADIVPARASLAEVFDWIRKESGIPFGQLIDERMGNGWLHISLGKPWRAKAVGQVLRTFDGKTYTPVS
jgi:zinc D-Ala-D-Ala carboxypeptidase